MERICTRGSQTVVGQVGRHLDVGDHDVGIVGAGLAHQVLGVARHCDHLQPGLLEHAHDALSDQWLILADHDAETSGIAHGPTLPAALGLAPHLL